MRECRAAGGCAQWAAGDGDLCEYHDKQARGLFDTTTHHPIDPLSSEGLALAEASRRLERPHDRRRCRKCRRGNKGHS